ncbi:hypothetical protein [Marinobacter sp. BGYM27]|uniref:hypothetical protein n=1 Tax=unclassified Marinobacter TaxID=83889 RepID=UPI0021A43C63|nr:hypothetical protein [Marinobacter sp. BGYM27]MDG5499793.1 hypothetical protein [Marinobacter sp. BGYM27]
MGRDAHRLIMRESLPQKLSGDWRDKRVSYDQREVGSSYVKVNGLPAASFKEPELV